MANKLFKDLTEQYIEKTNVVKDQYYKNPCGPEEYKNYLNAALNDLKSFLNQNNKDISVIHTWNDSHNRSSWGKSFRALNSKGSLWVSRSYLKSSSNKPYIAAFPLCLILCRHSKKPR